MSPDKIRELIARSCMAMDREDFKSYLTLCAENFRYRISAFSHELRRKMLWLDVDRSGLEGIFLMIPQHVRLQGTMRRLVSVYTIESKVDDKALVTSSLVTHTDLTGKSLLFATGEFVDEVDVGGEAPRLITRDVVLDTRMLGAGSHVPI